jgi:hypothetical protein
MAVKTSIFLKLTRFFYLVGIYRSKHFLHSTRVIVGHVSKRRLSAYRHFSQYRPWTTDHRNTLTRASRYRTDKRTTIEEHEDLLDDNLDTLEGG